MPLEYNIRRYTRAHSSDRPLSSPHPQTQLHRRYPLQGLQLDKTYPEWSIHGWHEDAQRLLQPPRALTPSVYAKSRSISHGSYSSGSEFDKPSRPHAPPGWRDTVHGTSKPYAPPSHQVNTLYLHLTGPSIRKLNRVRGLTGSSPTIPYRPRNRRIMQGLVLWVPRNSPTGLKPKVEGPL